MSEYSLCKQALTDFTDWLAGEGYVVAVEVSDDTSRRLPAEYLSEASASGTELVDAFLRHRKQQGEPA